MKLYDRKYFFETDGKHFLFPFVYASHDVLRAKGVECIKFSDLDDNFENKYESGDVVFGSIESCRRAFDKSNVETPKYIGYPKELNEFYGREIFEMDYSGLMEQPLPVFAKSRDEVKDFTGTVFRDDKWRTITLNGHEDKMFYVSKVFDIQSEWRVFIHDGNIYGCECYDGNPLKFPNTYVIEEAKKAFEKSDKHRIAYTIDVGIDNTGETFVIELNDMWGTGIYGAPHTEYTMAHIDRWLEIINQK